jgi:hypothetical protein
MSISYLQYSKFILLKVSFDVALFEKELRKCLRLLLTHEIRELKRWCRATFPKSFRNIMGRCFRYFWRIKAISFKKGTPPATPAAG